MLDSTVKMDNHLIWDGRTVPFAESYEVHLHHPTQKWSAWLKTELKHPSTRAEDARAELTGYFIDGKGQQLQVSRNFALTEHDVVHADHFVTLNRHHFSLADTVGFIEQEGRILEWAILFEDPVQSLRPLPFLCYHLPTPQKKYLSPRVEGRCSGHLTVDHRTYHFSGIKIYQAHRYGSVEPLLSAWAHCSDFSGCDDVVFEALVLGKGKTIQQQKKKKHFFAHIFYQGRWHRFYSLWHPWGYTTEHASRSWQFSFQSQRKKFVGKVSSDEERIFCKRPSQEEGVLTTHCLTPLAAAEINVYKKEKGRWVEEAVLSSASGCAFEVLL